MPDHRRTAVQTPLLFSILSGMEFSVVSGEEVPKTLYHYTSLDALVSIVKTKRFRASNIRFLNDSSESLRLKEDIVCVLRELSDGPAQQTLAKRLIERIEALPLQSLYVASFSEESDLLSQWRAYCPPGLGVSIGFDSECLKQQWIWNPQLPAEPAYLSAPIQRARYYGAKHFPALKETVRELIDVEGLQYASSITGIASPEQIENIVSRSLLPGWLAVLAPFIKHEAFAEENEWRKVISKDYRPMPGIQFRQAKSTLIPYIDVMLDLVTFEGRALVNPNFFINEVVVGPTPSPELTIEALTSLFSSIEHPEVLIRKSKVPFRNW